MDWRRHRTAVPSSRPVSNQLFDSFCINSGKSLFDYNRFVSSGRGFVKVVNLFVSSRRRTVLVQCLTADSGFDKSSFPRHCIHNDVDVIRFGATVAVPVIGTGGIACVMHQTLAPSSLALTKYV